MDSPTKANMEGYDPDFIWDDYLEDTRSSAAPPTAFSHIEHSLVSNLKIGMKLEVVNLEEEENCYWVASVVMICGPLLSLRYLGYDDERTADFWCDLKAGEFHPMGWCSKNNGKLYPPKGVRDRHADYMSLIVPSLELDTIPVSILEDPESGITPIDQIKPEMLVEVEDEYNRENIWPARIQQNVGGRLLLRYESTPEVENEGFWLFYLSERIHPIGWAKINGSFYKIPEKKMNNISEDEQNTVIESCLKEAEDYTFPAHILEPQVQVPKHSFMENMKLEILNPLTKCDIKAATVTKVINDRFFIVRVDSRCDDDVRTLDYPAVCCHSADMMIFPCNWAKEHGLVVLPPEGFNPDLKSLDWEEYLSICKATAAPKELFCKPSVLSKYKKGMKLEAVNVFSPDEIHAATIEDIIDPLLWIQFDSMDQSSPHHAVAINSSDVLPVGWCASNGYPLRTPANSRTRSVQNSRNDIIIETSLKTKGTNKEGKSWCPKIYFNHCCFTGPFLSKSRLAELPQAIGPGPLHLVMKDVLTRLINIAYKSSRVLKELQIAGRPDPKMLQQTIKAKYKGKSYQATVEFIRNSEQVDDFCRKICKKLDCCPHLFGTNHVGQDCPDKCYNLTKTKFGNGFVKRVVKKPNGSGEDAQEVKRGPGRRKKRKHWRLIHAEKKEDKESQGTSVTSPKRQSPKTSDSEDEGISGKKLKEGSDSESKVITRGSKFPESQENDAPCTSKSHDPTATSDVPVVRKKGRPLGSTKKAIAATLASKRIAQQREMEAINRSCRVLQEAEQIGLPSNPLKWTVEDVVKYVRSTPCAPVAYLLREQEIDGQALLMLTLYSVQEFLHLKPDPAKVLCSLVEKLKYEFFMKFT